MLIPLKYIGQMEVYGSLKLCLPLYYQQLKYLVTVKLNGNRAMKVHICGAVTTKLLFTLVCFS